jgi:hypothetical protein
MLGRTIALVVAFCAIAVNAAAIGGVSANDTRADDVVPRTCGSHLSDSDFKAAEDDFEAKNKDLKFDDSEARTVNIKVYWHVSRILFI